MIKRPTTSPDTVDLGVPVDDLLAGRFPSVWSYLVDRTYEDGSERQTATIVVFVEDGLVKVCLSDRDQQRSAWAAGSSLLEALEALDAGLGSGSVPWRRAVNPKGRRKGG